MCSIVDELILKIRNVSASYDGRYVPSSGSADANTDVLRNLSVTFERGRIHWLLGPNGAGKTTLFRLIAGDLKPKRGEIVFNNQCLNGRAAESLVHSGIGRFLQTQWVFPNLSILDNLLVAVPQNPGEHLLTLILPRSRRFEKQAKERALVFLEKYGFTARYDVLKTPAGVLSCGWAKLLSVVRLLLQDSQLWLLDEPIANVDESNQRQICNIIQEQVKSGGKTVLLIEHEVGAAGNVSHLADRAVLMFQGAVVSDGSPLSVKASQAYRDVFGVA